MPGRHGRPRNMAPRRMTEVVSYERILKDRIYGLHERIAWRAAELGITETEIARRMGVPNTNLSKVLNSRAVTVRMLRRVLAAVGWESESELHKHLPILENAAKAAAAKLFERKD